MYEVIILLPQLLALKRRSTKCSLLSSVIFTVQLGSALELGWIGIIRGSKFATKMLSSAPEKVIDTQIKVVTVELSAHNLAPETEKVSNNKTVEKLEVDSTGFDNRFFGNMSLKQTLAAIRSLTIVFS